MLWNPMEPRYAGIADTMLESGGWLVPRYEGTWYDQKPPLFFWTVAASLHLGADARDLFFLRLPSAVGALLALIGTWLLGLALWNARAGLVAAATLATCWITIWSGRFCHMDAPLAACVTWSILGLVRASRCDEGRDRRRWIGLATLAMACGLLIKGPVALLIPGMAMLLTMLVLRAWSLPRRAGFGWALLGALVPAAVWMGLAWQEAGSDWGRELLFGLTLQRHLFVAESDRSAPLYYVTKFWPAFGPWSVLVPLALWDAFRRRRGASDTLGVTITATWFLGSVILFSFAEGRRDRYLLPLLPACALILGRWLDRLLDDLEGAPRLHRLALNGVCGLMLASCGLVALGCLLLPAQVANLASGEKAIQALEQVAGQGLWPLIFGGLLLGCAVAGLIAISRKRPGLGFIATVACIAVSASAWGLVGSPAADHVRGDARLLAVLDSQLTEDGHLVILGKYGHRESTEGYFQFLTGKAPRTFLEPDQEFMSFTGQGSVVLLVRDRYLRRHPEVDLKSWQQITATALGHHGLRVFTNGDATSKREPRD